MFLKAVNKNKDEITVEVLDKVLKENGDQAIENVKFLFKHRLGDDCVITLL